jgi:hypothetical protein
MRDPIDDLLAPPDAAPGDGLKRDLLGRTTQALRWRHRWRRLGGVGVLVAAYVAGLLSVAAVTPPDEPPAPERVVETVEPPLPPTPAALEWSAIDRPAEAAALYREAGDLYLDEGDAGNAMRCYGNALDQAGSLEVNTDDSWLFVALKIARKKELNP